MATATVLGSLIGDYRLLDFLGAGGMGEVYRAVHIRNGQVAAVKMLSPEAGSGLIERFRNEARVQARLRHKNIATLYDFLEADGRPCIIMEYIDGPTLYDRIVTAGPLPMGSLLSTFAAIVKAVAYMHEQGVVHRDLKPNNVKLSTDGTVKLLDFGIAKGASTPRLTRPGDVVGTSQYLAPEQVRGKDADTRSDVWSLGVMLYEMTTGHVPFDATNMMDLYERIIRADFVSPSQLNPAVPPGLEALITQCLRKRPSERYRSASELLEAVVHYTDTVPALDAPLVQTRRKIEAAFGQVRYALGTFWSRSFGRLRAAWGALAIPRSPVAVRLPRKRMTSTGTWPRYGGLGFVSVLAMGLLLWWLVDTSPVKPPPPPPPPPSHLLSLVVDVASGSAAVHGADGALLGQTPYKVQAASGTQLAFVLRRNGYRDEHIQFEVNERRSEYVYQMVEIQK